ncbi:MAG: 2Fe-2S iron-sulfur cluster-binding protein [Verrucomicrobiota bacterium]
MAKVTFITTEGEKVVVEDAVGSLMEIAQYNDVEGITGDCGGVCSCSTCHVYVPQEWQEKVGPADDLEKDTLEFNEHHKPNSRLCCQIEMADELDGLEVNVAPSE